MIFAQNSIMHRTPYIMVSQLFLLFFTFVFFGCGYTKRITYTEDICGNGTVAESNSYLAILGKYDAEQDTSMIIGCFHCTRDYVSMRFVRIMDDGDIEEICELPFYEKEDQRNYFEIIDKETLLENVIFGRIQPPYGRMLKEETDTIHSQLNLYDVKSGDKTTLIHTYGTAYLTDNRDLFVHHEKFSEAKDSVEDSKVYALEGSILKFIGYGPGHDNVEYCSLKKKHKAPSIRFPSDFGDGIIMKYNPLTADYDTIFVDTTLILGGGRMMDDSIHCLVSGITVADFIDFRRKQNSASRYLKSKRDSSTVELAPVNTKILSEMPWDYYYYMLINIKTKEVVKLGFSKYWPTIAEDQRSILFVSTIDRYEPDKWKVIKLSDYIK